jgi:hypothetical protein
MPAGADTETTESGLTSMQRPALGSRSSMACDSGRVLTLQCVGGC